MLIYNLFSNPLFFFQVILIITVSISLHELGHGIAAISQGDNTPIERGHITLNPVVHLGLPSLIFLCLTGMAWGEMPVNPNNFNHPKWSNIIVSAAGPLTNFLLGLIAILLIKLTNGMLFSNVASFDFFGYVAYLNFALGIFNLCPIPPLDGFHVAGEFFPEMKPLAYTQTGTALLMILFVTGAGGLFFDLSNKLVTFLVGI